MTINYNVTGEERKRLVQVLGETLQSKPVYMRAPTYSYTVGSCTVDKDGTVIIPEDNPELTEQILSALSEHGFTPEGVEETPAPAADNAPATGAETADVAPETEPDSQPVDEAENPTEGAEGPEAAAPAPQPAEEADAGETPAAESPVKEEETPAASAETDDTHLTISVPRSILTDSALERLRQIVANKEVLFKRALSAEALPVEATEDKISFPWFTLKGVTGEAAAYGQFISALCQMAKEQTRILDKPYDGDNDRFAMRIFMVRMGMKGPQYALARKLMMQDLSGNSGWRFGAPPKKKPEQEEPAGEETAPAAEQAASGTETPDAPEDTDAEAVTADEEVLTADSESSVESDADTPNKAPEQEGSDERV